MPGLRHAHTLQQLQLFSWILTPGRVSKQNISNEKTKETEQHQNIMKVEQEVRIYPLKIKNISLVLSCCSVA